MSMTIDHTGQHLAQLHGAQLEGGCVACHAYLTVQAETSSPEIDRDPAEADPAEAEPTLTYYVKVKAYGMWQAPSYYTTMEEALAVIDAVPNPAVAVSLVTGYGMRNMEAIAAGVGPILPERVIEAAPATEPSSATCPIHGADCEAWA